METIDDIVREMRKMGENYSKSESNDCRYVAYWLGTTFADRLVAVAENATTTPTCDKSSQVGNAAALREALERLREWVLMDLNENAFISDSSGNYMKLIEGTIEIANAALSASPRNCDIYTMAEQSKRHEEYCKSHSTNGRCVKCPLWQMRLLGINCAIAFANLPYEKEGEK